MGGAEIDLLLLDLGGVVFTVELAEFRALLFGDARAHSREMPVELVELYLAHELGRLDEAAMWAGVDRLLGRTLDPVVRDRRWAGVITGLMPGMAELLDELAAGGQVRLAALSNIVPAHAHRVECEFAAVMGCFERCLYSYQLGVRKPQVEAFSRAARELAVAPDRVLFIDDRAENVAAARAAGMRAQRFAGAEDLRARLGALGVLGN